MIYIEQLQKKYRVGPREIIALRDIHLHIPQGHIFGIIGRSGAGKSSLLRTLNLLERPDAGKILIEGHDITGFDSLQLQQLRQRTGMVFQHFNLLNAKTVADNIDFPLKLAGTYTKEQRRKRVAELLELVELQGHEQQYPSQLSGGQKQRVGIARALANYPHLLLCDEATSALDPQTTQSILRLLSDINQKLGLTIVLITHEMQVIRSICDKVAVMSAGEIVETGDVAQVFLHPLHPVTQSLMAESQAVDGDAFLQRERRADTTLLRLTYVGDVTYAPVFSQIASQSNAELTILQGTISRIKHTPYGQLLIELRASALETSRVIDLLQQMSVRVDLLEGV
ncbi:methionine ABC transporter ATP-binding protein [Undibacterium sp. SXout7W]|uniref:methionine ABC transporter ATP-binding protein n=1 Tax=Undibacterium sp. SXout7W TaxID=3413049 RepID=UPI003BF13C9B